MARFLCRIGRHDWTQKKSEEGQPLMLGGQALEGCRHCDAVREHPWLGEIGMCEVGAKVETWEAEVDQLRPSQELEDCRRVARYPAAGWPQGVDSGSPER